MKKRIIELVENCKLIEERAVENGHDCWGKLEWTTDLYAYVNGKSERVFEGMFVIHDGKTIEAVVYDWQLKDYKEESSEAKEIDDIVDELQRTKEINKGYETIFRGYQDMLKNREAIISKLQSRIADLEQRNIQNVNLLNIASGDFQKASERIAELELALITRDGNLTNKLLMSRLNEANEQIKHLVYTMHEQAHDFQTEIDNLKSKESN